MGQKIGFEVKVGQKFDSKVKICDNMSKYWLLKVKMGQTFDCKVKICDSMSKYWLLKVKIGQNLIF